VKEALRFLIVPSLEKQLVSASVTVFCLDWWWKYLLQSIISWLNKYMQGVKHGNNSFRIRLTYTHDDASLKLHSLLPNDRSHKRKTGKYLLPKYSKFLITGLFQQGNIILLDSSEF
jgi:hypothetical protein